MESWNILAHEEGVVDGARHGCFSESGGGAVDLISHHAMTIILLSCISHSGLLVYREFRESIISPTLILRQLQRLTYLVVEG